MLISIMMNVCLQSQATACRQERIDFLGSVLACVVAAQPMVAEWTDLNPDWRVTGWKCRSS